MSHNNPQPVVVTATVDPQHPWLGLNSYAEETQVYFFGRDAEISEIFTRVRENSLTILYGQSGLGKSSLLGAGLLPKLKVERYRPTLIRLDFSEGAPSLVAQTATILCRLLELEDGVSVVSLWEILHHIPTCPDDISERRPVLIFDQFEEIFTRSSNRYDEVTEWFTQLSDLVENRPPAALQERFRSDRQLTRQYDMSLTPVRVLITLREDYLSQLERWKGLLPSLMRNRMELNLLSGLQALQAVVRPGSLGGAPIVEDEVGRRIVCKVARMPEDSPLDEIEAVPPFLSLLCEQLNEARMKEGEQQISAALVDTLGDDILGIYYEQSFSGQSVAVRRFVEERLVSGIGHRNTITCEDAEGELKESGVADPAQAINSLIARRLLIAEERDGISRLELTHDVLAPLVVRSRNARRQKDAELSATQQRRRMISMVVASLSLALLFGGLALYAGKSGQRAVDASIQFKIATGKAVAAQAETNKSLIKAEKATIEANIQKIRAEQETNRAKQAEKEAIKHKKAAENQARLANAANKRALNIKKRLNEILAQNFDKSITSKYTIFPELIREYADLIILIASTESMDENEKQYWFDIMPSMTDRQCDRLYEILETEKNELEELDKKYKEDIAAINKEYSSRELNKSISNFILTGEEVDRRNILFAASYLYNISDSNNYEKRINYLEVLLKYSTKPTDNLNFELIYYQLGSLYGKLGNPQKAFARTLKAVEITEQSFKDQKIDKKVYVEKISNNCLQASWYALLHRRFDEAVRLAGKGLKAAPDSLALQTNLAHGLLFLNRKDKAMEIYVRFIGRKVNDRQTWNEVIREDFSKLRKARVDHPGIKDVERILK
ncbi:MAG: hypothetical protein Q8K26_01995 [Candidatus Gracilibacteria bacterium]|nr:hypothetical protein [Candidatus Gracilibacteria bacterium]